MEIADAGGLEALTMHELGDRLGFEAMSLYNHVENKDDVLDGMVDLVFAEIGLPGTADWRRAMRERAISIRDALRRHPWAIGRMESRRRPGPASLRHHDAVLGRLRSAGFSLPMAVHAYSVLDSYIYGYALQQWSMPFRTRAEEEALGQELLTRVDEGHPHLREVLTKLVPNYDYGNEFLHGLDLILDALEERRPPAAVRRRGVAHGRPRGRRS